MAAEALAITPRCRRKHILKPRKLKRARECDHCEGEIPSNTHTLHCPKCEYELCGECVTMYPMLIAASLALPPQIVFSAHGDTCFGESSCVYVTGSNDSLLFGHMDNFAGVHAMMSAFFSGKLPRKRVQCKITYGEEKKQDGVYYAGAREVMEQLNPQDYVIVIDVTGVCPREVNEESVVNADSVIGHVLFEKVKHNEDLMRLIARLPGRLLAVDGVKMETESDSENSPRPPYTYDIWHECNDPQAAADETNAYRETQRNVMFLGVATTGGGVGEYESGGDYNKEEVFCWRRDIEAVARVVVELANLFVGAL